MNESDLRDLLPDERPLPTGRRREMEERLMQQIEAEGKTSRRHFRLIVGAAATAATELTGPTRRPPRMTGRRPRSSSSW